MTAVLSTWQARPYYGAEDLPAIAALINLCKTTDHLDGWASVESLQHEFDSPDFDPIHNIRLWENATGELCGYADCWLPESTEGQDVFLFFCVHPLYRNQGIEAEIFAWVESRGHEAAQTGQQSVKLRCGARADQTAQLELLARHGFTADRYFYRMARSLVEPIPEPQLPAGFTVRPLQGLDETAAWVDMFNHTFIDHWNFIPLTTEVRQHWMSEPEYMPDLDLVAIAPEGSFAAFCYSMVCVQENARTGKREGWVADLGTRRGFRNIGLGRAMLLTSLHTLKAQEMETALLAVDAENPSGALRLYESVGFQKRYASINHVKQIA